VDRFADKYTGQSGYQYAMNNPIKYIDVNGGSTILVIYGSGWLNPNAKGASHDVGQGFRKNAEARAEQLKTNLKEGDAVEILYTSTEQEYIDALNNEYPSGTIKQVDVYAHGSNNSINLGGPANGPVEKTPSDSDYRLVSAMKSEQNPDGNDETQRINSANFSPTATFNLWGCNLGGSSVDERKSGMNHAQSLANSLGSDVTVNAFNGGGGAEFKTVNGKNIYDGTMIRSADRSSQRVIQTAYKPK
jgi:hypothetical protein